MLYLLFPQQNNSLDAWVYACDVKFNEELFSAHHLLYAAFQFWIVQVGSLFSGGWDALRSMLFVNGLAGVSILFLLQRYLIKAGISERNAQKWMLFAGSSYGVMRFATENETYVIPIFFSLLASYFIRDFIKQKEPSQGHYLASGIAAALACLFHQIHFFWWVGLLLFIAYQRSVSGFVLFMVPALMVPLAYSLVLIYELDSSWNVANLLSFVFEYYYSEGSETAVSWKNLVLTPISFIRSHYQLHGRLVNFFLNFPIFSSVLALVSGVLIFVAWKKRAPIRRDHFAKSQFYKAHVLIFLMQLAFAFYSKGNAEFMVMLPVLMVLILSEVQPKLNSTIGLMGLSMLIWNLGFGVLPDYFINYQHNELLVNEIRNHPNSNFVLREKRKMAAQYRYFFGHEISDRLYDLDDDLSELSGVFITDVKSKKMPFSRADIADDQIEIPMKVTETVAVIPSYYGEFRLEKARLQSDP